LRESAVAKKKAGCGQMAFGCLFIIILGGFLMFKGIDTTIKKVDEYQEAQKVAQEKLDKEMPKGSVERLNHDIEKTLGKSNRGNQRVEIKMSGSDIDVYIFADDNLTPSMAKTGIQTDVTDTLEAVKNSGYEYGSITVKVSAALVDTFGNSNETLIVTTTYNKATVDRINWDNFIFTDVFSISDDLDLNPVFFKE